MFKLMFVIGLTVLTMFTSASASASAVEWMLMRTPPPANNADLVTICMQRVETTANQPSLGTWVAQLNPALKENCELLRADLRAKRVYLAVPGFASYSGGLGDKYCPSGQSGVTYFEGKYSRTECKSAFLENLSNTGNGYLTINDYALSVAMKDAKVIAMLERELTIIDQAEQAKKAAKVAAQRESYHVAARDAINLHLIAEFEQTYGKNDPDNLLPEVLDRKPAALLLEYREAYERAESIMDLDDFIAKYSSNDSERLVPLAKKKLVDAKKKEVGESTRKLAEEAKRRTNEERLRKKTIRSMHEKYQRNIDVSSVQAWNTVRTFEIDCKMQDRRSLPLVNVLYASIRDAESMGGTLKYTLDSRGKHVRIYSTAYRDGKRLGGSSLSYEINEWGELRPHGIHPDALYNACLGPMGRIWKMPGD